MELFGYVGSVIMGLVLGMIGAGGSIMTVPLLIYFFGMDPVTATGESLLIVGATAFLGVFLHRRKTKIRFAESMAFAVPSVVGVLIARRLLMPLIPEELLSIGVFTLTKSILLLFLFAVLMIFASFKMLKAPSLLVATPSEVNTPQLAWRGFLVGSITGFVGAGGGFLIVPALVFFIGLGMKEAVGTSLMIVAINSLVGFISSSTGLHHHTWDLLVIVLGLALAGLILGTRLQGRFSETGLKKAFGWFVLLVGGFILIDSLLRLKI